MALNYYCLQLNKLQKTMSGKINHVKYSTAQTFSQLYCVRTPENARKKICSQYTNVTLYENGNLF